MKRILFLLICLLLVSLTSCTASSNELDNHLGKWSLQEITTTIAGQSVTIRPNDPMYKENEIPVSFILTNGETDIPIDNYFGDDAKDIKVGDQMCIALIVFITKQGVTFQYSYLVTDEKEIAKAKTLEKIKEDAEAYELEEGKLYHQYKEVAYATVKEITKPYEMVYYPEDLAILTLNEDGSGKIVYNFDYLGTGLSDKVSYNLTWYRYTEEIRITLQGETERARINEDGYLVFSTTQTIYGQTCTAVSIFHPYTETVSK